MNLPETLRLAKFKLIDSYPYFASVVWRLNPVSIDSTDTPFPMAVDKNLNLYYNMEVMEDYSIDEVTSVLVHEINHVIRDHSGRAEDMGVKHHMIWNIAADAEINDDLRDLDLPDEPVYPETMDLEEGGVCEKYYRQLMEQQDDEDDVVVKCGSCAHGKEEEYEVEGKNLSDVEKEIIRRKVAEDIQKHSVIGSVPKGLERWADNYRNPSVDWRKELSAKITQRVSLNQQRSDYSYRRPNRRQNFYGEFLMPSLVGTETNVSVIIDTSGSMSDNNLSQAIGEVSGILKNMDGTDINVISCDADTKGVDKVFNEKQIILKGGGGTNMAKGIETAVEETEADFIVVLTDGDTPWPDAPPEITTIVCLVDGERDTPNWAQTVVPKP